MRQVLLTLFIVCILSVISIHAQDYKLGLGIRFSDASPTISSSITAKYFFNETSAVDGLISFGTRFGIGGLYEIHTPLNATEGQKWYYGGGAYVGFQNHTTYAGPQGVVGLDYKFSNVPLNLSLDWKPELDFSPSINFVPDAFGLTARFTLQ